MSGDQTVYAAFADIGHIVSGNFHLNAGCFKPRVWRMVQDFDSRGYRKAVYIGRLSTDDPNVWRVLRWWTGEVIDITFPTQEAAIVYAVMLTGSE